MAAGAIRAGQAFIELTLDSTKFVSGINTMQSRMKRIGTNIASAGAQLAGFGVAGLAAFVPAIRAASDFEESLNVFGVVFGKNTDEMRKWAAETGNAIGRSEAQMVSFLGRTKGQLLNFGFDDTQATEMSKSLSVLAVDLASFWNATDQQAMDAIASAFRGESEPISRFNITLNEAAVAQELLNQSIDPDKATAAQKAFARYSIILQKAAPAMGDSVKTAGSFANQMKRLQAAAENIGVAMGSTLLPILTKVSSFLLNISGGIVDWVRANPQLAQTIFLVAAGVTALGAGLVVLGGLIAYAGSAIGLLTVPFGLVSAAIGLIAPAIMALLSPIGILTAALIGVGVAVWQGMGGIGPVIDYLGETFQWLVGKASEVFGAIAAALQRGDISAAANVLWATLQVAWATGIGVLKAKWVEFKTFMLSVFTEVAYQISEAWVKGTAGMQKAWVQTTSTLKSVWAGVVASSQDIWNRFTTFVAEDRITARVNSGEITKEQGDIEKRKLKEGYDKSVIDLAGGLANTQTDIEKKRKESLDKINSDKDKELASLGTARQEELGRLFSQEDATIAAAQEQLNKAKQNYENAVAEASSDTTPAGAFPGEVPLPPELQALPDPAAAVAEAAKVASRGGIVGGERAGQVFGDTSDQLALSREQLITQKKMLSELERERKSAALQELAF